jgi:hypothetical protein
MIRTVCTVVLLAMAVSAAAATPLGRGLLVYPDGNRLTGRLLADGVFASDLFGEVRFDSKAVRFEPRLEVPDRDTPGELRERVDAEVKAGTPATPAAKPVSSGAKPWKFSISGFADATTDDGNRRREYYGALRIERPSQTDPLILEGRYEYRRVGSRLDRRRATGSLDWRHPFPESRWFTLYRPYFEYDGRSLSPADAATLGRTRIDYIFTQQQAGVGYNILAGPKVKSNAIVNWNHFHVWVFHLANLGRGVPSLQLENTFPLTRSLELKQTGQIYWLYEAASDQWLWENYLDLTQHFGSHFFLTLRHEYRKDHPLRDATPLDRLRLLFGVNF